MRLVAAPLLAAAALGVGDGTAQGRMRVGQVQVQERVQENASGTKRAGFGWSDVVIAGVAVSIFALMMRGE